MLHGRLVSAASALHAQQKRKSQICAKAVMPATQLCCFLWVSQFKDKKREKQRQSTIRAKEAAEPSVKLQQSGTIKRPADAAAADGASRKLTAAKRRLYDNRQDAHDMADDYALLKN